MNIQWYPGHMAKTKKLIAENLKLVDVVIEILDARIPMSSKNPIIDKLVENKPRLVVLNKSDISDSKTNAEWETYFKVNGIKTILVDSIKGKGLKETVSAVKELAKARLEHEKSRGRLERAVRVMIIGIPNVGKSSFINKLVGKPVAKAGDRPGVTRGKQWVRISSDVELLDTPGILWPKFEDEMVGLKLAFTGAVKDEIMDIVELAAKFLEYTVGIYPDKIKERYKIEQFDSLLGINILKQIGKKRGALVTGGEVDLNRIAQVVLDEFRGAKIGNISLERPNPIK